MEFNAVEVMEVVKTETEASNVIRELVDLELAIVGGGCGEVIFA